MTFLDFAAYLAVVVWFFAVVAIVLDGFSYWQGTPKRDE